MTATTTTTPASNTSLTSALVLVICGKSYSISRLPIRANREWRAKFDQPLSLIIGMLNKGQSLMSVEFSDNQALGRAIISALMSDGGIGSLVQTILGSMDLVVDALFAYSPVLQADREWIETHASDEDALRAFIEVLKIAYPFGSLVNFAKLVGPKAPETSPNLPSPSGDSGKTI